MNTQTITYGGVTFPYTQLEVEASPQFADDGIQQEGIRYDFNIRGLLSAATPAALNLMILQMRDQCSKRGLQLTQKWTDSTPTDTTFYSFGPSNDDDWGPRPDPVRFVRFAGGIACGYEWHVSAFAKECFAPGGTGVINQPPTYLQSITTRWSHAVDINGLTTRTMSGKLKVSSRSVVAGFNADQYRYYVEPALAFSFQRVAREYETSADGRELTFSIVDVERAATLPDPITDGRASFGIKLAQTGLLANFTLSGYFCAPRAVGKDTILQRIFALANSYLSPYYSAANPVRFESQELTAEVYGQNRVDFSFSGFFAIGGTNPGLTPNFYSSLMSTLIAGDPNSNGQAHLVYPYGGDSNGGSGVSADDPLWRNDACNEDRTTTNRGVGAGSPQPGGGGSTTPPPPAQPASGGSSPQHLANPWIAFHEELHYEIDNGLRFYEPKVAGTAPFQQQVHLPTITVIQGGYAVRVGTGVEASPPVPGPIITTGGTGGPVSGVVISASIQPSSPEPLGDGTNNRYTVHWRYVMRYTAAVSSTSIFTAAQPQYSADPRRAGYDSSRTAGNVISGTAQNGGDKSIILPGS